MLRRLVFSCLEQDEVLMRAAGYSFGSCGNICDTGDLYIPPSDLRVITDGNAVAWIRSHLAPLGITFDE
ncbi:hypothetical protein OpiT1DRAFT_01284 [Opitutaceae bacterium TAV1]|nr:hypothetical protein OpiT1DRAFT_01284 [Opitutaceae bacterium TAV1]